MVLYERSNWLNPQYKYVFGRKIVEYDIQSAGLSLIKEYSLLDNKSIDELDKTENKKDLVIKIGLLQKKNKEFTKNLSDAFKDARRRFFKENRLLEENILSIKKDAFFIIETNCKVAQIGKLNFRPKHRYSSFLKLNKLEFYLDTIRRIVDIKGLGQGSIHDKIIEYHLNYILKFMIDFARGREVNMNLNTQSRWLSIFVRKYRNKELDLGYYRELSQTLDYKVNAEDGLLSMTDCPEEFRDKLEISYNYYNIIVPIISTII